MSMPANDRLDTVLLLALPASGKSEVRTYMASVAAAVSARDFHVDASAQLDDFPYVHVMRRIDEVLAFGGVAPIFFRAGDQPFGDARDWGTLVELVNDDYADLVARRATGRPMAATALFERIDRARTRVGAPAALGALDGAVRARLCDALEREARQLADDKDALCAAGREGKTVVIEFARGGADGSAMPLAAPYGYAYSLAQLSPTILARAVVLYIWVTPEESRRKNEARTDPNDPGSILHHSVPIAVMRGEYGCDDMAYLVEHAERPGTLTVTAHGNTYHLPVARFDNRVDKTSFVREPRERWSADDVTALHQGLAAAFGALAGRD